MKTPSQRGPFGSWLHAERTRRYRRQADALADMRRLAGLNISESEFAQWESGSRVPREDNPKVARLYEFFGSRPTDANAIVVTEGTVEGLAAVFTLQLGELRRANELAERRLQVAEDQNAILMGLLLQRTTDPRVQELVDRLRPALAAAIETEATRSPAPTPDPHRSAGAG